MSPVAIGSCQPASAVGSLPAQMEAKRAQSDSELKWLRDLQSSHRGEKKTKADSKLSHTVESGLSERPSDLQKQGATHN